MLGSIRKFSGSIYAKILLGIVIIPFVFMGFGGSFSAGNKNIILKIDKEKYTIQDFRFYINRSVSNNQKINSAFIDEMLYVFIGDKLIEKEIEYYKIKLSDESLNKLIKHQKDFKRDGKFSRMEYEKFLLKQNISSVSFEEQLKKHEKKKQFIELISGGVLPPNFLVNASYDKLNQKRNIKVINLNNIFGNKSNFSNKEIDEYYKINKANFNELYKHVKIIELTPKNLIGLDEFNETFYSKIDEIDDLISEDVKLESIIQKFNLETTQTFVVNSLGNDLQSNKINNLSDNIVKEIFDANLTESTSLIEFKNKFFIFEIIKSENIEKGINNEFTRTKIISELKKDNKRKSITKILSKVNSGSFNKLEFDKFSNENNIPVKLITLSSINDVNIFPENFTNQIYAAPEEKVIVVYDINFEENYLVYIESIEHVTIDAKSIEFKKYMNLSRYEVTNNLFNTYDNYIKKRYKIDINYETLKTIKNSFN